MVSQDPPSLLPKGEAILVNYSSKPQPLSDISILFTNVAGKSSPMMEVFSSFSMVGVYETMKGLKFVHVTSEVKCLPFFDHHSSSLFHSQKFVGKFTILIFMDNRRVEILNTSITDHHRLSELEAGEWRDFSEKLSDFKAIGAQVSLTELLLMAMIGDDQTVSL